jgi:hypothetical protein
MTVRVSRRVLVGFAVVVAAAALGAGAFFIGRSSRDTHTAYRSGFRAGEAAGRQTGITEGESKGESRGKELGHSEGRVEGLKQGHDLGLKQGQAEGQGEGLKQGAKYGQDEAFEGYNGGWEVGSWYLIKVGTGTESGLSGKYSIPSRVGPMKIGRAYSLCEGGICSQNSGP